MKLDMTAQTAADMAYMEMSMIGATPANRVDAALKTYLWCYGNDETAFVGPSLNEVRDFLKTEGLLPKEDS